MARLRSSVTDGIAAPSGLARVQRILAVMTIAIVAIAALCIIVLLVCLALNVPQSLAASGPLQLVSVLPLVALPIGLLLFLAAVAVNLVVRARAAR